MCTRVVYLGKDKQTGKDMILTGRNMDWTSDEMMENSNLWAFDKDIERNGAAGPDPIQWTSQYKTVVTSYHDGAVSDGINEAGLVANMNYLTETKFPEQAEGRKSLAVSAWVQYVLENYATVAEAVKDLEKEPFYIVSAAPPGRPPNEVATTHLSISDASGDSAIFQYIEGKLNIHHNREYQVMTNSPIYEKQLALNEYWERIGGMTMLPGTNRSEDRFVRASFYINAIPQKTDIDQAIAAVFSVIRNASVPLNISTSTQPIISCTRWRTVADSTNKRYFFESAYAPYVVWVNLADLKFEDNKKAKNLVLKTNKFIAGDVTELLEPADPFEFRTE
ncbi:linear amide C-N hydrolase [Gloeothece verrucosa]|uniref:Choloylglycine hydrolase n=1 Tax=Gloeothece verrucosa (strain PCC 7822) TaxID=497965 RepID=E0UJA9_GLOV7|nr:linear amide C-N hydrolase [Gloeothece verrucosa]ADN15812.1 Choloylglycine hydrolase [Gloeothece verrucosa PCC 7822]